VSQRSKNLQTCQECRRPTARHPTRLVPCPAPPPPPRGGAGSRHSGGDGGSDGDGSAADTAPFRVQGGEGGAGLSTGREGGAEGTTATHGDATPEGERPLGVVPLDDERGTTTAHVTVCVESRTPARRGVTVSAATWRRDAAVAGRHAPPCTPCLRVTRR